MRPHLISRHHLRRIEVPTYSCSRLPCPLRGHCHAGQVRVPQYRHLPSRIARNGVHPVGWESQQDAPGIPLRIHSVSTFSEPRVQDNHDYLRFLSYFNSPASDLLHRNIAIKLLALLSATRFQDSRSRSRQSIERAQPGCRKSASYHPAGSSRKLAPDHLRADTGSGNCRSTSGKSPRHSASAIAPVSK
jgi:hypothetical protein